MFALRRIAARAVFAQPARQLSTLRPAQSRTSVFRAERATLHRSFHQSRRWLADEEKPAEKAEASPAEAETSGKTVTTEPSPAEQNEIREESIATPDVVEPTEQKAEDAISQAQGAASSAAETARDMASSAAETVSNAASTVAQTARQQFSPRTPGRPGRDTRPSKILYVGNLFFEVSASQLEAEFGRFGQITNSRVVTDARGLSKGFAYVEFASQESADRAVQEMDQKNFQGRRMAVQYHVRREPRAGAARGGRPNNNEPSKTLFIGNMSYQMSDRDLNDLFREIRNVLDVRVAIDRRSGQPRGFAHADFVDVASAQRAKEHLEQKVVYGRQLRVDYSQSSSSAVA